MTRTTVEQLDRRLDEHVETLRQKALHCPPGGDHHWDERLAFYQTNADPPHLRVESVVNSGQSRGASIDEFKRVLASLARFAGEELDRVLDDPSTDPMRDHNASMFRARLSHLVSVEGDRYARDVGAREAHAPSVSSSVSSIFKNAATTSVMVPWKNVKIDPASIMSCFTCGAPQEKPLDFKCRYCRKNIYEKNR